MSILINDGVKISKTNTPTREGERIASLSQMGTIPTPYVGMRVFVEDSGKEYVITSLKEKEVAGEVIPNAVIDTYVELAYQKSVDELQSTLEGVEANLAGAIEAEKSRAEAAEKQIQNNISTEYVFEYGAVGSVGQLVVNKIRIRSTPIYINRIGSIKLTYHTTENLIPVVFDGGK